MIRFTFQRITDPVQRERLRRSSRRFALRWSLIMASAWGVGAVWYAVRKDESGCEICAFSALGCLGLALFAWLRGQFRPIRRGFRRMRAKLAYFTWRLRLLGVRPTVEKWEIAADLFGPAGDMVVRQTPNGQLPQLTVTLRFRGRDLQIVFERVLVCQWAEDGHGFTFARTNAKLPRVTDPANPRLVRIYPLLRIERSPWALQYARSIFGPSNHYVLLSEVGTLEVLALEGAAAAWLPRADAADE